MPPIYAVLGATGSIGSEVVRHLLPRNDIQLHIYARSAEKLHKTHPSLQTASNATIFTGPLSGPTLTPCLRGASAIISTLAQTVNQPGCRIARDAAQAIAEALQTLRAESTTAADPFKAPTLAWISSGALCKRYRNAQPWIAEKLLYNASWYIYEDLRLAEAYLASELPWLRLVRACPAAIVPSNGAGVRLHAQGDDTWVTTIAFQDVAKGMILMAEGKTGEEGEAVEGWGEEDWAGKQVTMTSPGEVRYDMLRTLGRQYLLPGTICSLVPGAYPVLKRLGLYG